MILIKGRARKFYATSIRNVFLKPVRSDINPVIPNPIPVLILATAIKIENIVAAIIPSVMYMEIAKYIFS